MTCTHCSEELAPTAQFCPTCGTARPAEAPAGEGPVVPPPPTTAPVYASAVPPADSATAAWEPAAAAWDPGPSGWDDAGSGPADGGATGSTPGRPGSVLLAALVVLVVAANSFAAAALHSYSWRLGGRWLILLPAPASLTTYRVETAALALFAAVAAFGALVAFGGRSAGGAARVLGGLLALALVGVFVGNATSSAGARALDTYLLSRPESVATWVCLALALGAGFGALFAGAGRVGVVLGLVAGMLVVGAGAGSVAVAAPTFPEIEGSSSYGYSGGYSTDDANGDDGSGGSTSVSGPASVTANAPGDCATGWSTLLDTSTPRYEATVCTSSVGTYLFLRLADGTTVDLPATATGGGWSGFTGTTRYVADSNVIAIYVDGRLTTDEAVTSNPTSSAAPSQAVLLAQLADLVQTAHDGRSEVIALSHLSSEGCGDAATGLQMITQVIANRSQLVTAAQRLEQSDPEHRLPIDGFLTSMQDSLTADQTWSTWLNQRWAPYARAGCPGDVQRAGDADYDAFTAQSHEAEVAKAAFVAAYDPLASAANLPSTWASDEI